MHTADSIIEEFNRVDSGQVTNVHFSHANVVMCSKEHYAALMDCFIAVTDSVELDRGEDGSTTREF